MDMYPAILLVHSWVRWAVLIIGLAAVAASLTARGRPWTATHDRAARFFVRGLDVQFLLGLLLYLVLSPFTRAALEDFGAAMRNPQLRFWAVEHVLGMVVAMALANIGRVRIRKAVADRQKHRTALIFFGLALVAIVASIPWPGMPTGRPLIRW